MFDKDKVVTLITTIQEIVRDLSPEETEVVANLIARNTPRIAKLKDIFVPTVSPDSQF